VFDWRYSIVFCPPRALTVFTFQLVLLAGYARADVVAAWHFNEGSGSIAYPAVGSISGTLTGNAAFTPGGISGGAVSMTTLGNGLVDMGNNFGFTGNGSFSLVAWVKLNNGDSNGYIPVGKHHATVISGYFLGLNNAGSGSGEVTGGAIFYQAYPNPVSTNLGLNDGAWHQLVGVHDFVANQARLYVDGVLRQAQPFDAISATSANFAVGGILNPAGNQMSGSFTGLADEVSIWDHALSATEVKVLFDHPGLVPEPTSLALAGCMGPMALAFLRRRPRGRS
jgi:hypothetical protein